MALILCPEASKLQLRSSRRDTPSRRPSWRSGSSPLAAAGRAIGQPRSPRRSGRPAAFATDYQIINRLDDTKTRIYDCTLNGNEVCVTEQNGIANDVTATAKLLFANNLSGGKPSCAD